jgi:hypothetical protein
MSRKMKRVRNTWGKTNFLVCSCFSTMCDLFNVWSTLSGGLTPQVIFLSPWKKKPHRWTLNERRYRFSIPARSERISWLLDTCRVRNSPSKKETADRRARQNERGPESRAGKLPLDTEDSLCIAAEFSPARNKREQDYVKMNRVTYHAWHQTPADLNKCLREK